MPVIERPTCLANAHATLDHVVRVAYGRPEEPAETDDETIPARLPALNLEQARPTHPAAAPRRGS